MIELDDCGKTLELNYIGFKYPEFSFTVKVQMVITAPRGTMALFESNTNNQCEAIRAFMEEHKDD